MGKVLKVTSKKANDSILRDTVEKAQKRIHKQEKGKIRKQQAVAAAAVKVEPPVKNEQKKVDAKQLRKQNYYNQLGVLLVSHIPHGFFEEQLRKFFRQFGKVMKVRVMRSTISGRTKGYGFVVFRYKEVANIAAETANNYLMGKRILKAKVIPSEEVKGKWFHHKTPSNIHWTLASRRRGKSIKSINRKLTPEQGLKRLKTQKGTLKRMVKKLREKGINFKCEALNSV